MGQRREPHLVVVELLRGERQELQADLESAASGGGLQVVQVLQRLHQAVRGRAVQPHFCGDLGHRHAAPVGHGLEHVERLHQRQHGRAVLFGFLGGEGVHAGTVGKVGTLFRYRTESPKGSEMRDTLGGSRLPKMVSAGFVQFFHALCQPLK